MTNPDILAVDKYDKLLCIKGLQLAGEAYADKLDLKDYRVSPIYGDLNQLPKISIFIGTHDLFIADSRKLKSKLDAYSDEIVHEFRGCRPYVGAKRR
jgi:acetyl esterase/lipase